MLIKDESFPEKRFKSNKMINRATFGSEATLHISEQIVGFKIPDMSTVDNSFHGFTDATCEHNRTIIVGFVGSLPGFGIIQYVDRSRIISGWNYRKCICP